MADGRDTVGLVFTRGFAIAGVALVVGLTHAMISKVSVTPEDARATRAGEIAAKSGGADGTGGAVAPESRPETGDAPDAGAIGEAAADMMESAAVPLAELASGALDASALGDEITLEQTHALVASGQVHVIDARTRDEFVEGHLPGAMWLPADQIRSGDKPMAFYMLTYELPIVIYCGGGDCEASHNVATRLLLEGFERTHVFVDGYPAWVDAGHEVSVGPDPLWEDE